jgi:hypothetical protein
MNDTIVQAASGSTPHAGLLNSGSDIIAVGRWLLPGSTAIATRLLTACELDSVLHRDGAVNVSAATSCPIAQ